jgi:hypothetical protein
MFFTMPIFYFSIPFPPFSVCLFSKRSDYVQENTINKKEDKHKMTEARFEPTIPATKWPRTKLQTAWPLSAAQSATMFVRKGRKKKAKIKM